VKNKLSFVQCNVSDDKGKIKCPNMNYFKEKYSTLSKLRSTLMW